MKEIQQSVLVLFNGHPQLVDLVPKVLDLWTSGHVARVFKILQGASNLGPMAFGLSSDVVEGWLCPGARFVEL